MREHESRFHGSACRFGIVLLFCLGGMGCPQEKGLPTSPADRSVRRVVSLLPNATEILFALGAGDRVVGVTRYCDRPQEARGLPQVGGILDVSLEAVLDLRPDLVVGSPSVIRGHLADLLDRAGVKRLTLTFEGAGEVEPGIRALGKALGLEERAETLCQEYRRQWDALKDALHRDPPIRTLVVVGRSPLVVAGEGSLLGALVRHLGMENVVEGSVPWPTWSPEEVLRARPDLVVDAVAEEEAANGPGAFLLPGGMGRLVRMPDRGILRPGPGFPAAARALVREIRGLAGGIPRGAEDSR